MSLWVLLSPTRYTTSSAHSQLGLVQLIINYQIQLAIAGITISDMNAASFLEITPSDTLKFIKTSAGVIGYLYLRNQSDDCKLVLAKVSIG